ncbi:MAG TPA: YhfC family glutamic-type intramembrane protease, partial [Candidatus Nanoarchaeia archaeon]|nr:YhfC family glutamic-type intramembrane protease [Candidatus Nanoarchaeia archaeon]
MFEEIPNIDSIFILQPLVVIVFSATIIIYWHFKRNLGLTVFIFALLAYAFAIALKVIVQELTGPTFISYFGFQSVATGIYYGLQTSVLEVGLAYAIAVFAVARGRLHVKDAQGYGLSLAFWENAIVISLLPIINTVAIYVILALNTPFAPTLYHQLQLSQPVLFLPASQALPLVGWGILERVSSLLIHLSWGYLCVVAAVSRRKRFVLIALPMGFVDFLVPFASVLTIPVFEVLVFAISVIAVAVMIVSTRSIMRTLRGNEDEYE